MKRINTRRWSGSEGLKGRDLHVAAIVGVASLAAGAYSASQQSGAAEDASNAQSASAASGIAEQRRQFDNIQKLLAPYNAAGTDALGQQRTLVGLNGNGAQQQAIDALQKGPQFTSLLAAGNNNILQNASATGGLRGGNTQAALAQFSPALLSSVINDQYSKLGGLTSIGQNAAAGVGNAGMQTGNQVSALMQQMGAAQAGNALAQGRQAAGLANGVTSGIGAFAGLGGFGSFGGNSYTSPNAFGQYQNPSGNGYGVDPYGNLGGAGSAGDFSDVRLKTNIKRIGTSTKGHALYDWEWKASGQKGRGVIAQEVAHVPGAVAADPRTGFLTVDYSKVL
jgi:hypothetical protein